MYSLVESPLIKCRALSANTKTGSTSAGAFKNESFIQRVDCTSAKCVWPNENAVSCKPGRALVGQSLIDASFAGAVREGKRPDSAELWGRPTISSFKIIQTGPNSFRTPACDHQQIFSGCRGLFCGGDCARTCLCARFGVPFNPDPTDRGTRY